MTAALVCCLLILCACSASLAPASSPASSTCSPIGEASRHQTILPMQGSIPTGHAWSVGFTPDGDPSWQTTTPDLQTSISASMGRADDLPELSPAWAVVDQTNVRFADGVERPAVIATTTIGPTDVEAYHVFYEVNGFRMSVVAQTLQACFSARSADLLALLNAVEAPLPPSGATPMPIATFDGTPESLVPFPSTPSPTPGASQAAVDPFADQWWEEGHGPTSHIEPLGPNAPPAAITKAQALQLADKHMQFEGEPDVVLHGRIADPPGQHTNVWLIVERYAHGERRWVSGPPCEQPAPSASTPPCEPRQHWYRMTVAGWAFDDQTGDDIYGFDELVPEPTDEVSPAPTAP